VQDSFGVYGEARLSLIDKNIGTSARFYAYAYNTEKSHTEKLSIFLTGARTPLTPLVWLRHWSQPRRALQELILKTAVYP